MVMRMGYVPCEWYYENILGDSCNNKCNECFGDSDIYICKSSFEVTGDMLETVLIEEDSWWSLIFINNDHALLDGLDGYQLTLKRDLFDLYFESFIYNKAERSDKE